MKLIYDYLVGCVFLLSLCCCKSTHSETIKKSQFDPLKESYASTLFSTDLNENEIQNALKKADSLVSYLNSIPLEGQDSVFIKAFLINNYNLHFTKQFLSHEGSVLNQDFFETPTLLYQNKMYSFRSYINEVLLPYFEDLTPLFLIQYGTLSYPRVVTIFDEHSFEIQKKTHLMNVFNDNTFIRIKTKSELLLLPELFHWYQNYFQDESKIKDFIQRHSSRELPPNFEMKYYPWSWKKK